MAYDPYASNASKMGKGSKYATFDWGTKKAKFYKIKENGDYSLDIIPFIIGSNKHPDVVAGKAKPGDETFYIDFWTHSNVGPRQQVVICPSATFGKSCPICEAAERAKREFGPKSPEFEAFHMKHRIMYNVVNPSDEKEEIMVFEESFPLFSEPLIKTAGAKGRRKGKEFVKFGDIGEGWTISFTAEENAFKGGKYFKFSAFDLDQREQPHSKSLVKEAYSLDEYMIVKSYEELEALMTGDADADDEPEEDSPSSEEKEEETSPSKKESGDPKRPAGNRESKD